MGLSFAAAPSPDRIILPLAVVAVAIPRGSRRRAARGGAESSPNQFGEQIWKLRAPAPFGIAESMDSSRGALLFSMVQNVDFGVDFCQILELCRKLRPKLPDVFRRKVRKISRVGPVLVCGFCRERATVMVPVVSFSFDSLGDLCAELRPCGSFRESSGCRRRRLGVFRWMGKSGGFSSYGGHILGDHLSVCPFSSCAGGGGSRTVVSLVWVAWLVVVVDVFGVHPVGGYRPTCRDGA